MKIKTKKKQKPKQNDDEQIYLQNLKLNLEEKQNNKISKLDLYI